MKSTEIFQRACVPGIADEVWQGEFSLFSSRLVSQLQGLNRYALQHWHSSFRARTSLSGYCIRK